eukprot:5994163-Pleurochrysis_carterae.AAC.1
MVSRFCIASHAYLLSARAPLPKLLETRACDGRRCPVKPPSLSHRVGASSPAPALAPSPPT